MTKEELCKLTKIKNEIELLKEELTRIEPEYTQDSVTGSCAEFPFTKHTIKIAGYDTGNYERKLQKIQNRLNRKLNELVDEKDRLTEYISNLKDSELRQIFIYRYMKGCNWDEIGQRMNNAAVTVRKKHDKYLKNIT